MKSYKLQYEAPGFTAASGSARLLATAGGRQSLVVGEFEPEPPKCSPRHNEINENLARKICKDLGVPAPMQ